VIAYSETLSVVEANFIAADARRALISIATCVDTMDKKFLLELLLCLLLQERLRRAHLCLGFLWEMVGTAVSHIFGLDESFY